MSHRGSGRHQDVTELWRPVGKFSAQNVGTAVIPLQPAGQATGLRVVTTGFALKFPDVRSALKIVRYFADFSDQGLSGRLYATGPMLIDITSGSFCVAEYSTGFFVSYDHFYSALVPPGIILTDNQQAISLVDDWFLPDDFEGIVGSNISTIRIQSALKVGNADSAAAHTVSWIETVVAEWYREPWK